jgi:serine phosphatase RsbU (regulator of sigma subunit)
MDTALMSLIEWGIAEEALPGQQESGDHYLVKKLPSGILLAVVDGIGHGQDARHAAELAIKSLDDLETGSLIPLVRYCQQRLQGTRGVVLSMAFFSAIDGTMTWLGVGNVEGVLLRAQGEPRQESLLLRGGLVGAHLPPVSASTVAVNCGDLLVLATDGIRSGFAEQLNRNASTQEIAREIIEHFGRGTDDALVLVARYVHKDGSGTHN